jgi:hypothetical protein
MLDMNIKLENQQLNNSRSSIKSREGLFIPPPFRNEAGSKIAKRPSSDWLNVKITLGLPEVYKPYYI